MHKQIVPYSEIMLAMFDLFEQTGKYPSKRTFSDLKVGYSYSTSVRKGINFFCLLRHLKKITRTINCAGCSKPTINPKFCCSSCSATVNNLSKISKYTDSCCLNCGVKVGARKQYCNNTCQQDYIFNLKYQDWLNNTVKGVISSTLYKKFVVKLHGYSCASCSISEWNGKKLTLELEHKDGNSENNLKDNLCLLCPNCHSQTDTYRAKNKGNGRHSRRQRYAEGKSY